MGKWSTSIQPVNEANVIGADISASNGIITLIDSVLFPQIALDADAVPDAVAPDTTAASGATAYQIIIAICSIGAAAMLIA